MGSTRASSCTSPPLHARGTEFATAQVTTLRERLFKLGGWIERTARRITLHLPNDAAWRREWSRLANTLQAAIGT